jgi:hypothetical protein
MEQPIVTTTVTRPWNWGIVVIADPSLGGEIPAVDPDRAVSANDNGLVVLVVHAQDVDCPLESGTAEASITTRLLVKPGEVDTSCQVIFRAGPATSGAPVSLIRDSPPAG